jgi:hypothetical protein
MLHLYATNRKAVRDSWRSSHAFDLILTIHKLNDLKNCNNKTLNFQIKQQKTQPFSSRASPFPTGRKNQKSKIAPLFRGRDLSMIFVRHRFCSYFFFSLVRRRQFEFKLGYYNLYVFYKIHFDLERSLLGKEIAQFKSFFKIINVIWSTPDTNIIPNVPLWRWRLHVVWNNMKCYYIFSEKCWQILFHDSWDSDAGSGIM